MFVRLFAIVITVYFLSLPASPSIQEAVLIVQPIKYDTNMLRQGVWVSHGVMNIKGDSTENKITFRIMRIIDPLFKNDQTLEDWTIKYTHVKHFGVGRKKGPNITTTGPFPVEVDKAQSILTVKNNDPSNSRYTFAFSEDGSKLKMPAFVEVKPGHFLHVNKGKQFEVKCEHDPRKIPVGKAWMSGSSTGQLYYSYEEMPRFLDWTNDKSARYLRIMERIKESGHLIERGRLIWDDLGSPRYEQILSTGQPRSHQHHIKIWSADP